MGIARRADGRLVGELKVGVFQRLDEAEGNLFARFAQVVIDHILDIPAGWLIRAEG